MFKRMGLLLLFVIIFLPFNRVRAQNMINEIDMHVFINNDGEAKITEKWDVILSDGTETYRNYTNLGKAVISNFRVYDETGVMYTPLTKWNSKLKFDKKAYKSGLKTTKKEVELCWGISKYGHRIYTLEYTISNFITEYADTQALYFNLLNLNHSVLKTRITISTHFDLTKTNSKIWAFGYDGTINFEEGKVVLETDGLLKAGQYMVPLIKFEDAFFEVNNKSSKSFDDIYDEACNDIKPEIKEEEIFKDVLSAFLKVLLGPATIFVIVSQYYKVRKRRDFGGFKNKFKNLDYGSTGNKLPSNDVVNYWRDIPCNKDLIRAYFIAYQYGISSEDHLNQGLLGAMFLKWVKDGLITIAKDKTSFEFNTLVTPSNEIEKKLFIMMLSVAGTSKVLRGKELKEWCLKNYNKIEDWFRLILDTKMKELEKEGLIKTTQKTVQDQLIYKREVDSQLFKEAIHLQGFKKFLLDFGRLSKKDHLEVHLWEEYLIYAQFLGIADKVASQFKKLSPDFNQIFKLDPEVTTALAKTVAFNTYQGAAIGYNRALTRGGGSGSSDRGSGLSRGGGGRSSGGGGRSAGGSSGGGFR